MKPNPYMSSIVGLLNRLHILCFAKNVNMIILIREEESFITFAWKTYQLDCWGLSSLNARYRNGAEQNETCDSVHANLLERKNLSRDISVTEPHIYKSVRLFEAEQPRSCRVWQRHVQYGLKSSLWMFGASLPKNKTESQEHWKKPKENSIFMHWKPLKDVTDELKWHKYFARLERLPDLKEPGPFCSKYLFLSAKTNVLSHVVTSKTMRAKHSAVYVNAFMERLHIDSCTFKTTHHSR